MKTLGLIAIVGAFFLLNSFIGNDEINFAESEQSTFGVYAIHELEVKSDIDISEFETFVLNEIAPIYNKMKGQSFSLVKGDRGVRSDKYAIILTFDSLEDRNRIYPPSGELVGDFGSDAVWEKLNTMLDKGLGESHTDYIKVIH